PHHPGRRQRLRYPRLRRLVPETQGHSAHSAEPGAPGRLGARCAHRASTRLRASQRVRKRVEDAFAWMKTISGLRKTRYRGRARVQTHAYLVAAAYNLLRMAKLSPIPK